MDDINKQNYRRKYQAPVNAIKSYNYQNADTSYKTQNRRVEEPQRSYQSNSLIRRQKPLQENYQHINKVDQQAKETSPSQSLGSKFIKGKLLKAQIIEKDVMLLLTCSGLLTLIFKEKQSIISNFVAKFVYEDKILIYQRKTVTVRIELHQLKNNLIQKELDITSSTIIEKYFGYLISYESQTVIFTKDQVIFKQFVPFKISHCYIQNDNIIIMGNNQFCYIQFLFEQPKLYGPFKVKDQQQLLGVMVLKTVSGAQIKLLTDEPKSNLLQDFY